MARYAKAADRPRKLVSKKWPGTHNQVEQRWGGESLGFQKRIEEEKMEILFFSPFFFKCMLLAMISTKKSVLYIISSQKFIFLTYMQGGTHFTGKSTLSSFKHLRSAQELSLIFCNSNFQPVSSQGTHKLIIKTLWHTKNICNFWLI